eukprot:XP_016663600.1 PREDICTED: uncharacterized protein LOC107884954 [Acyrthosiphon pisum]
MRVAVALSRGTEYTDKIIYLIRNADPKNQRMKFVGFKMIFIIALSLMRSVVNSEETSDFKLPTNFKPVSYELNVTTHLEDKFMFEGVVCIRWNEVGFFMGWCGVSYNFLFASCKFLTWFSSLTACTALSNVNGFLDTNCFTDSV